MEAQKKMNNITLEQAGAWLAFIVAFLVGIKYLKSALTDTIKETVKSEFDSVKKDIDGLQEELLKTDREKTKNYLVARLAEIEKGEKWSDVERQRFFEQYDHYRNDLNGNTYIERSVTQVEKEGKIWR